MNSKESIQVHSTRYENVAYYQPEMLMTILDCGGKAQLKKLRNDSYLEIPAKLITTLNV